MNTNKVKRPEKNCVVLCTTFKPLKLYESYTPIKEPSYLAICPACGHYHYANPFIYNRKEAEDYFGNKPLAQKL